MPIVSDRRLAEARERAEDPTVLKDDELRMVSQTITNLENAEGRFAQVIRQSYDMIYDGQNTGRYSWDQLAKTERTHFGTIVEINVAREFDEFDDGDVLDFKIAGIETDCKWSQDLYGWEIPPEAIGRLCMVLWADDERSIWWLGVVRAAREYLSGGGGNRDQKRTILKPSWSRIRWIWRDAPLPPNVLLQVDHATVKAIFAPRSGQQKVNELFRRVQGRRITRSSVAAVAKQLDPMKRVRYDGGARSALQDEGIIILSGDYAVQRDLAEALGLPTPSPGEFVSAEVRPADPADDGAVRIDDGWWRLARPGEDGDPDPAPVTPSR